MAFGSNKNTTELIIAGDNKGAKKAINETVEKLDQAERKIQRMSRGWGDALSTISNVNPIYLLGGAALAAAGGLSAMAIKATQTGAELSKMVVSTGLSVEQLSALKKISEDTGIPINDLVSSYKTGNDELLTMVNRMIEAGEVMSTDFVAGAINAKTEWDKFEKTISNIGESIATVVNHDLQWFEYAWLKFQATINGENKEELESFAVFQLHQRTKIRLQQEEAEVIRKKIEEEKKAEEERRRAAERLQRQQEEAKRKQLAWAKKGLENTDILGGDIVAIRNIHNIQMQMIEERKEAIIEITDLEMYEWALMNESAMQTYANMAASAEMFFNLSGQKSKEWFAIYKAFSIAQAVINTYEGATKALAQGGIFGPILAASVIAFGMAQVATIAAQQPGSSYGGGASGGGAISSPTYNDVRNTTNNNGLTINVQVYGYMDKDAIARDLVPAIRKAYGDGVK